MKHRLLSESLAAPPAGESTPQQTSNSSHFFFILPKKRWMILRSSDRPAPIIFCFSALLLHRWLLLPLLPLRPRLPPLPLLLARRLSRSPRQVLVETGAGNWREVQRSASMLSVAQFLLYLKLEIKLKLKKIQSLLFMSVPCRTTEPSLVGNLAILQMRIYAERVKWQPYCLSR